jgi:hypothetical protein
MVGINDACDFSLAGTAFIMLWSFLIPCKKLPNFEDRTKAQDSHVAGNTEKRSELGEKDGVTVSENTPITV